MFTYRNSLCVADDCGYPVSVLYQKESRYPHRHGYADQNGFHIHLPGSTHLFCTPDLTSFQMQMHVDFRRAGVTRDAEFGIVFGFQPIGKTGYSLQFLRQIDGNCSVTLCRLSGSSLEKLDTCALGIIPMQQTHTVTLSVSQDSISGTLEEKSFSFSCAPQKGRVGLRVTTVFEFFVFTDVELSSPEDPAVEEICNAVIHINNPNGGMLPYQLHLDVRRYENSIAAVNYTLSGGISTREKQEPYSDTWDFQDDVITNPYIKIIEDSVVKKYYLYNESVQFMDSNSIEYVRNILEHVITVKDTPLNGTIFLPKLTTDTLLGFGYENYSSNGTSSMCGAYEYILSSDGKTVLYNGEPLEKEIIPKFVSPNKRILKNIPDDLYDVDAARSHAEKNHYFYSDETPLFTLRCMTRLPVEFLSCRIILLDAFFETIEEIAVLPMAEQNDEAIGAYRACICSVSLPALSCGVYHISADLILGDAVIHKHTSAFEVFDAHSDLSPQQASNLPHFFHGDAGPALLEASLPEFYAQREEYDWAHYVQMALYQPIPAQKKRIWEILKLYNRELFVWMTKRTIKDYNETTLNDVVEHSDYVNYIYPGIEDCNTYYRYDFYTDVTFGNTVKAWTEQFLRENPHIRADLGIENAVEQFTEEDRDNLLRKYGAQWLPYCLRNIEEKFKKQTAELRQLNPTFKRSSYGPFSIYAAPYKTAYATKWQGFDPTRLDQIFDGFLQFEDYPFSCSYNTSVGAFGVMTIKFLCPQVKIYPELYMDFPEGCPDGAVCMANPPFGGSKCPPRFTATQIAEYVYNTPYYKNGAFGFWKDFGFSLFLVMNRLKERSNSILTFWGKMLKNKPVRPGRTTAFLYEIHPDQDRYELDRVLCQLYNISESNMAYLHELMRAAGYQGGFATSYEDLLTLSEADIDSVVLTDLTHAPAAVITKLRQLHKAGVALIGVGKIPGLEDIFGVRENSILRNVTYLTKGDTTESLTPYDAEFFYEAEGGTVAATTDSGIPVVITTPTTVLLNTSISQFGIDNLHHIWYVGRTNVSILLKEVLRDALDGVMKPAVRSSPNTGVSIVETEQGDTLLVLTDYSDYTLKDHDQVVLRDVVFSEKMPKDIQYIPTEHSDVRVYKRFRNGSLCGFSVEMQPWETMLFHLVD